MALRITAIYLILAGFIGSVWPFLNIGTNFVEFEAKTLAFQLGSYAREFMISVALLVSGIGILKNKLWARKLGLIALALAFFYGGSTIAWGVAGGKPQPQIIVYSYLVAFAWYGMWFYFLYRKSTIEKLTNKGSE